jgi:hypothetical protein
MKSMLVCLTWMAVLPVAATLAQPSLMAWYPLNGTPNDTLEQYPAMKLTNTPFQAGGGIYCNGVYIGNGAPDRCDAETPKMPISFFKGFTLAFDYKADSFLSGAKPVMVGGAGWRWIAVNVVADGSVQLYYNNGSVVTSSYTWPFDLWHHAVLTYDSSRAQGRLFIDGLLACTASFTIIHGAPSYDWTFSVNNRGAGSTFKGMLKDVMIYSSPDAVVGIGENGGVPPVGVCVTNYPEPFARGTTISYQLPEAGRATVRVYDMLGREVALLHDAFVPAGAHVIRWNATGCASGQYLVRVNAGGGAVVRLVTLRR